MMTRDDFLKYLISWFLAAASKQSAKHLGRDSKISPVTGITALQALWANRSLIPEQRFDAALDFCYDPSATALWFKTTALGRLNRPHEGDVARQFTAGKPISLATMRFKQAEFEKLSFEGQLDLKTIEDANVQVWMSDFAGLDFTPIEYQGNVVIAYQPGHRSRWMGIRPEEKIVAVATYPANDSPSWHQRCLALFPAIQSVLEKQKRKLPEILPFPRAWPLPCLEPTPDTGGVHKAFRHYELNPARFETFCQELLSNLLEIPEDEQERLRDAARQPRYIADLDTEDKLYPKGIGEHPYDQCYEQAAIPRDEPDAVLGPPGKVIALHLPYIPARSDAAGRVVNELETDDRLNKHLSEQPAYLVITSNLDEEILQEVLSNQCKDRLIGFSGRVLLLGRRGILAGVHSHYGLHREAIGHPLDKRVLALPFLPLPSDNKELRESPGMLLQAKYGLVRFDRAIRIEALTRLREWLDDERPVSVLLVAGPGGAGKTRLVAEFLRDNARTWKTGMIQDGATKEELQTLAQTREPLLCAVDYGETNAEKMTIILRETAEHGRALGYPLKLLVTTRNIGDWWKKLVDDEHARRVVRRWEPVNLAAEKLDAAARARLFKQAVIDYSPIFSVDPPLGYDPPRLDETQFAAPLFVLMAALLTVYTTRDGDAGAPPDGREELLEAILKHERQYWNKAVADLHRDLRVETTVQGCLERIVTTIALVGGTRDEADTIALVDCVAPECRKEWELLPKRLAAALKKLYPWSGDPYRSEGSIAPLQPDALADHLVATRATEQLVDQLFECEQVTQAETLVRTLDRVAATSHSATALLEESLGKRPGQHGIAAAAIRVAIESGGSLLRLITAMLQETGDVVLAEYVVNLVPPQTTGLLELVIAASEISLRHKIEVWENPNIRQLEHIATLATTLATNLSQIGRLEEALEVSRDAVETYGRLDGKRPGAYKLSLVNSLIAQATYLEANGREEEARATIEEAEQIRTEVPGRYLYGFREQFADWYAGLGMQMAALGCHHLARSNFAEAVGHFRGLARRDPDAYRPDLALSLRNMSVSLAALGQCEEAQTNIAEAVEIFRGLARKDPDAYQAELAKSLYNLGVNLITLGRHEEALAATDEAVELFRPLASRAPDLYQLDLAKSLAHKGVCLGGLGRGEKALKATEKAIQVFDSLARRDPDAYRPDLARSSIELGLALGVSGMHQEALAAIEKAVEIFSELATDRPDAFLADLASAEHLLAVCLVNLSRYQEALAAAELAAVSLTPVFSSRPEEFIDLMKAIVENWQAVAELIGRKPDPDLLQPILEELQGRRKAARNGLSSNTPGWEWVRAFDRFGVFD